MKKWHIAISILLVFALGTAAGAYGSRVIFKKRVSRALRTDGTPGIKVIQAMMGRLDLSEDQRAAIKAILDENNKKWVTIRDEYEPKIKELFETVIEETKKELTDEQRKEIEQMSAKVQRRLPPHDVQRSTSPPGSSPQSRSSALPGGESGPLSMNQPFGRNSVPDRVADIIGQLQIEPEKSAEVQSIIETGLTDQQALKDEFKKAQAASEERFQKEMADAQEAAEKKLAGLLTPEQMETYRRIMSPEEPRHENFGFDDPDDAMQPKDFNQEELPISPEEQPSATEGSRPEETPRDSRSI
jgi:Spy/CpxP family protein refolding chaperone